MNNIKTHFLLYMCRLKGILVKMLFYCIGISQHPATYWPDSARKQK